MTFHYISFGVVQVFRAMEILILTRVIISWMNIRMYRGSFALFVAETTEPLLMPFRKVLSASGAGIDLSPIFAFMVLQLLQTLVLSTLELVLT